MLVEVYGEYFICERMCRDWFGRFKDDNFDVEYKERSGRPKLFGDEELKTLLDEDSCDTQDELAVSLGVTQKINLQTFTCTGNDRNAKKLGAVRIEAKRCRTSFLWIHFDYPKREKIIG